MITLLRSDPGWQQMLARAGFSSRVGRPDAETRVLVVPSETGRAEIEAALADCPPDTGTLTDRPGSKIGIPQSRRSRVLPFRLESATQVGRAGTVVFATGPSRPVVERVAACDRGEVRRAVVIAIRGLLADQALPCVRLASTPAGTRSVFGFRVDTDYCGRDELAATRRLADETGVAFSWFLNTGAHGPMLGELGPILAGQDVQVHCHRHQVFRSVKANQENIGRAAAILRTHGHQPTGAAAPYGDWNPAWDQALARLGFEFSSDFAAGYDDLPFRPLVKNEQSSVLQVPVHPVCLGRLRAARASNEFIVNYFRSVLSRQIALREPCLFYDHPSGIPARYELIAGILRAALAACGSAITLSGYSSWWRRREQAVWSVAARPDMVELTAEQPDPELEFELEHNGQWARVPFRSGRYLLTELQWNAATDPGPKQRQPVPLRSKLSETVRWFRRQFQPDGG